MGKMAVVSVENQTIPNSSNVCAGDRSGCAAKKQRTTSQKGLAEQQAKQE